MTRQMKHVHAAQLNEQIDEEDRYLTTWTHLWVAFIDLGNSIQSSIDSAGDQSNRASITVFYDDVSTVSPVSFTDEESIIDIISNEEQDTRACEGIDNDTALMCVDGREENEDEVGIDDRTDKTAQNKVCLPHVFLVWWELSMRHHEACLGAEIDNACHGVTNRVPVHSQVPVRSQPSQPVSRPRPRPIYKRTAQ
jgi:hypothetical protein